MAVYVLSDAIDRLAPTSLYLNCIILAKQTKAWLSGNCRFSNLHISLSDNILTLSQILRKKVEFLNLAKCETAEREEK